MSRESMDNVQDAQEKRPGVLWKVQGVLRQSPGCPGTMSRMFRNNVQGVQGKCPRCPGTKSSESLLGTMSRVSRKTSKESRDKVQGVKGESPAMDKKSTESKSRVTGLDNVLAVSPGHTGRQWRIQRGFGGEQTPLSAHIISFSWGISRKNR